MDRVCCALLAVLAHVSGTAIGSVASWCDVPAKVDAGWVCGEWRQGVDDSVYASFRGVPYAKQPLGELRFQELQPAEPWDILNTTQEGPICPQLDYLYGRLQPNPDSSEACIHANIHVPREALLSTAGNRLARELQPPYITLYEATEPPKADSRGAPILVMIHGGGFAFGAGDAALYGPERLVAEGLVVVTFNYRLNVFGFLSLNSSSVPGNQGLRDMVTLLRWVRRNARAFGGDPDDVTLAGQSAGAAAAHLLSLSKATEGLFKRVIMMSGTAISNFFTPSPAYAQYISNLFLGAVGINSTDPEEAHRQLIKMPLDRIVAANNLIQEQTGLVVFFPVVESKHDGVTQIIDEDPEVLLAEGRGKDITLLVGYTNVECENFRPQFQATDILSKIKANPLILLPPSLTFSLPPNIALEKADIVSQAYFNGFPNIDSYVQLCTDSYFQYPALKLARLRQRSGGAPLYMYEFAYDAEHSVLKESLGVNYTGAGHMADLTYAFQVNAIPCAACSSRDLDMKKIITAIVANFVKYGQPSITDSWQPIGRHGISFQYIESPELSYGAQVSDYQANVVRFFDSLQRTS